MMIRMSRDVNKSGISSPALVLFVLSSDHECDRRLRVGVFVFLIATYTTYGNGYL